MLQCRRQSKLKSPVSTGLISFGETRNQLPAARSEQCPFFVLKSFTPLESANCMKCFCFPARCELLSPVLQCPLAAVVALSCGNAANIKYKYLPPAAPGTACNNNHVLAAHVLPEKGAHCTAIGISWYDRPSYTCRSTPGSGSGFRFGLAPDTWQCNFKCCDKGTAANERGGHRRRPTPVIVIFIMHWEKPNSSSSNSKNQANSLQ